MTHKEREEFANVILVLRSTQKRHQLVTEITPKSSLHNGGQESSDLRLVVQKNDVDTLMNQEYRHPD